MSKKEEFQKIGSKSFEDIISNSKFKLKNCFYLQRERDENGFLNYDTDTRLNVKSTVQLIPGELYYYFNSKVLSKITFGCYILERNNKKITTFFDKEDIGSAFFESLFLFKNVMFNEVFSSFEAVFINTLTNQEIILAEINFLSFNSSNKLDPDQIKANANLDNEEINEIQFRSLLYGKNDIELRSVNSNLTVD